MSQDTRANNVKDPRSVDCGGIASSAWPPRLCAEEIRKIEAYPEIAVLDFVRLMKDFLDKRIDVYQYCRSYCELNVKRFVVSEEESKILQQALATHTISTKLFILNTRSANPSCESVLGHLWRGSRH